MAKSIKKGFLLCVSVILLMLLVTVSAYRIIIPDRYTSVGGEMPSYPLLSSCSAGAPAATEIVRYDLFGVVPLKSVRVTKLSELKLYAGGMPFGIKFMTSGVMVVGFCGVDTKEGQKNPSLDAGLCVSDMIKSVDGKQIKNAAELTALVESSDGRALEIKYTRGGKEGVTTLTPAYSEAEGKYKTGIYVRDSGAGIGTVTFIDPESYSFAGLGHGICDAESGALVEMERGSVTDVTISGIVKGEVGAPGEIKGYFSSDKEGSLLYNTDCGVFGLFVSLPEVELGEPMAVASRGELVAGKAHILCTLDTNKIEKYEVEISNIDLTAKGNKCFCVKVTDKALLEKTGGIIQGMSGSPIIQNGKLVGAVTHVLINDPTRGYGIFIENMLTQMGGLMG